MIDYTLNFEPIGWKGKCRESESILACARRSGLGVISVCGGQGTCHTCRIQVLSGILSEPTLSEIEALSPEELAQGCVSPAKLVLPAIAD